MQLVFLGFQVSEEAADEIVDQFAFFLRQVGEGRPETHLAAGGLAEIAEPGAELRLGPGLDRAFIEGKRFVGNHAVQVEIDGVAESLAARAGADRRIEAEQNGLGGREFHATRLALELLVEAQGAGGRGTFANGALENHFTSFAITDLDRVDQALVQFRADRDAVHQHENGLAEIDIEQRFRRRELEHPPGLKQPREALLAQFEEMIAQRGRARVIAAGEQRVPARTLRQGEQARRHFIDGVLPHHRPARRAKRLAHARVQQAQKIVALGRGGNGRTRVARRVLLPDGNRRARCRRYHPPPAFPCAPGTAARTPTSIPRSAAGPPHRSCRTPARIFPSPIRRSPRSTGCGESRPKCSSDYGFARRESGCSLARE